MSRKIIERKKKYNQQQLQRWESFEFLSPSLTESSETYQAVLEASATHLRDCIAKGKWSSETVLRIFCHQALKAHLQTNCCTEFLFERALDRARILDAYFQEHGRVMGPLHGVPISVKDLVHVRGYDATSGYSRFALNPCSEDSMLVRLMEEQGAVVFVKTNVPQTLMTFECSNPLYGRTLNPCKKDFTCGGSSGGEAALIALKGSCLGLGSDIAGSLRIPAHFCGIYALKPSSGRLSLAGKSTGHAGQTHILPTMGPMARCVEDLELWMQTVINARPAEADSTCLYYRPFRPFTFKPGPLRIGYYLNDGLVVPAPACSRAVQLCIDALKQAGHELVPFQIPTPFEACQLFYHWVGADGLKTYMASLGSDPMEKHIRRLFIVNRVPSWLKNIVCFFMSFFTQTRRTSILLKGMKEISIQKLYVIQAKQQNYTELFKQQWDQAHVEFIIGPGFGFPAVPHDTFSDTSINAWYTGLYNMINYSVGAIPVTRVQKEDQVDMQMKEKFDLMDKIRFRHYDCGKMEGLPVGVQIIGGYREDERTLAAMKLVDEALKKEKK